MEIEADGTFRFELLKGPPISWPRIVTPEAMMTIGSARPMEDAARIAYHELVQWLATAFDYEVLDAYQLLTQVGGLAVANMVNSLYSVVASCPKRYVCAARETPVV